MKKKNIHKSTHFAFLKSRNIEINFCFELKISLKYEIYILNVWFPF